RPGQPTVIFQNDPRMALTNPNVSGVQVLHGNPLPKGAKVVTVPGIVQNPTGPHPTPTRQPQMVLPGQAPSSTGRPRGTAHTGVAPHAESTPRAEAAPAGHASEVRPGTGISTMGPGGISTGGLGSGTSTMGSGMGTSAPSGHGGSRGNGGFAGRGR
ncbi:MAG TPA: hypothetical protein VF784_17220, partial [Anaerolineales bacterium]